MENTEEKKERYCWVLDYLYGERLPECNPCKHCACEHYARVKREDDEHD